MAQDSRGRQTLEKGLEDHTLSVFQGSVMERFSATAWPGTELIGHKGFVFVTRFDEALRRKIVTEEDNLWNWSHNRTPPLPEDLCAFREGEGYPSFVSVTHERKAWLLSESKTKLAGLKASRIPLDQLFWPGKWYCRS